MMDNENEVGEKDTQYLQAEFFSNQQSKQLLIPKYPFSLPSSASPQELNRLLNSVLKKENAESWEDVHLDFLIDGTLLRDSLKEFLGLSDVGKESVLRIECVTKEPAPTPEADFPHDDWVGCVIASPSVIVSGTYDDAVHIWPRSKNLEKSQSATVSGHDGPVKCVSWIGPFDSTQETLRFVTGSQDQSLIVWKYHRGSVEKECVLKGHERSVECCVGNREGNRIASGGFDSYLKIWNPGSEEEGMEEVDGDGLKNEKRRKTDSNNIKTPMVTLSGHKEAVTGVCWTNNPKEIATASWDHSILIWDLELAEALLTGSVDKHVRLWDPRSKEGSMVKQTFTSHEGWVTAVNWHPNRDNLFVSASYDKLVKMWDTRSPKAPLYDLSGHVDRILACDWSDPSLIVSGGADSTLKCFSADS